MQFVLVDRDGDYFAGSTYGEYGQPSNHYTKVLADAVVFRLRVEAGRLVADKGVPEGDWTALSLRMEVDR